MRLLLLLITVLSLSAVGAQKQDQSPDAGVIYGTVISQKGTPAKGVTLNAMPMGVVLGMALPWTKTNDAGVYRFERLPLGRYTVYAEDKDAGYSNFTTGTGDVEHQPEVELTIEHSEAEFNFKLLPPAGFILFHLTNRSTGAPITGIEVTVMSDDAIPKTIFSGSSSSTDAMLVPSNTDLLLHVRSWGFLEWAGSAGAGKHIHLAPGDRLMLDVQLQPSNRLTRQIPSADQKAYQGIRDAKDWRNPYLIVRADGIEVAGVTNARSLINVDAATTVLEGLPDSAWPYGRVVAVQESGVLRSESDQSTDKTNRSLLVQRLNDLGVIVDFWPPA